MNKAPGLAARSELLSAKPVWHSGQHWQTVARFLEALRYSDRLKIVRYLVAGIAVSIGYTLTVVCLVEFVGWGSPSLANLSSFLLWTPVSYIVHRDFTFRFDGEMRASAVKFLVTFLIKLVATVIVVVVAMRFFGAHYIFGVLANWIVVPLVTYAVLNLWVFVDRRQFIK